MNDYSWLIRDGKFRKSTGRTMVKVIGYNCTPQCAIYKSRVLIDDVYSGGKKYKNFILLSDAMKHGLFGPNCHCGLTTYFPELEDNNDDDNQKSNINISVTTESYINQNQYLNAVPKEVYDMAYIHRKNKKTDKLKNYVVFDTETTGLDPSMDRIIELSAVKYIDNKPMFKFSMLVNPLMELPYGITQITGIRQIDLYNQPTINQVLPMFYNFIGDFPLIAHNAPFDIKMIACEAYRSGIPLCNNEIIDTIPLAKKIISKDKVPNYKLETLKTYLGLNFKSHRALDDCFTCAQIYRLYLTTTQKRKVIIIDEETGEVLQEVN